VININNLLKKARKNFRRGEIEKTLKYLRQILNKSPDNAEALHGMGVVAWQKGNLQEAENLLYKAIDSYTQKTSVKISNIARAHYNLGLVLLTQGKFIKGWSHIEWRLKLTNNNYFKKMRKSIWDGSDLGSKKLLLQAEGGFGDTLQFVRYAKFIAQQNPNIILLCQPQLARLFKISGGFGEVIPDGECLPPFDVYCPLFSIPKIFKTTIDTIPKNIPYLRANYKEIKAWRAFFPEQDLNVGLVWAGNPRRHIDPSRSMTFKTLTPLFDLENTNFYSLQLGSAAHELKDFSYLKNVIDLSPYIIDFADSAAIISALDLLITVDTAPAHLAGALGCPVWNMIGYVSDWRWLAEREDSPWYPTMKLFRQEAPGDWDKVVERIRNELSKIEK